jgi:DNA (cytosine-5)-methyltransferase 3A
LKVLSLFDGISCGMVALERAGIPVDRYVAYEIDENAIKVSKYNFPTIEQKGDVFKAEYTEGEFDLLIGGSPCTHWSIAKCGQGQRETKAEGIGWELFMQYVRALQEVKPKWFLYENNFSMSPEIKRCISEELGCQPIYIDSADFSAQHRHRLYWTNIPVATWEKNPILFEDIMEKEGDFKYRDFSKFADTVQISKDGLSVRYDTSGKGHYGQGNRAKKPNQKWNTLPSAGSNTKNDIWVDAYVGRHLLPVEMERLQTLPDGYTSCLNSAIKTMRVCGNGWTVDVIAHIFTGLKGG